MDAVFDRAHFDLMTGADRALQLEVLGLFRAQIDGWDARFAGADWRMVVHTIKGSARGIGLHELAAACERAEAGSDKEPGLTQVRAAMQDALAALDAFSAAA